MTSITSTTRRTTIRTGIAATFVGLALAATACGTETTNAPDRVEKEAGQPVKVQGPPLRSPDAIERAARARAEHADALRWAQGHTATEKGKRSARAERADALRWAHGHTIRD